MGGDRSGSLTYTYDADGRRTQVGGSLAATGFPQAAAAAAYDVANELTNWYGTTISYDANGNIQNDGVASYTWNARNQLISRGATSLQYDSYGRRTLNPAGSNLFYEGWDGAQELSGSTPVANRILGGWPTFTFFVKVGTTRSVATLCFCGCRSTSRVRQENENRAAGCMSPHPCKERKGGPATVRINFFTRYLSPGCPWNTSDSSSSRYELKAPPSLAQNARRAGHPLSCAVKRMGQPPWP
jgi:hypothetical protein